MLNRPIRTVLPSVNSSYTKTTNKKLVKQTELAYTETPDKSNLSQLQVNDEVRLFDGKKWSIKGTVIENSNHPRSYVMHTQKGTKLRRNRKHILLTRRASNIDPCVSYKKRDDSECSFSLISDNLQYRLMDFDLQSVSSHHSNSLRSSSSGFSYLDRERDNANSPYSDEDSLVESIQNLSILDNDIVSEALEVPIQPVLLTTRSGRVIRQPSYLRDYDQAFP